MGASPSSAHLYLNGTRVGTVSAHHARAPSHPGWNFGDFSPSEAFAPFAPLFGRWSLLMHAEDDRERLSAAAAEELRLAESALDALHVRLYLPEADQWCEVSQLNIDGPMIEWKIV